ncbi:MAG TPA: flagellar biosynthesis protein FlhA [Myxococcota bacterium]|nr:flagellar biosynthesis protein FlhA [Myxococcota bacterium]
MKIPVSQVMLGGAFFFILALLVVPLPAAVLDLFLSLSLTLGLLVLLLALFVERPLDFSVFPSLLLIMTLMRLGLNVGSTRLILLHGNEGSDAAGYVIQAFGEFTVGGNYAIGIVIFLIFVIINMVVITKGAGRIAEVAARFTLDAMPGKQMAIDADLNQGVIDDAEARKRRVEVQRESDFYGAMDGASKFVKGDAIAGIVIMLINLVGGLAVGVFQEGLPLLEAAQTYTTLTVGDGLVSQVPALVVSAAAGVIVSRAGAGDSLAAELQDQVILQPKAMSMVSGMLGVMALVPGLPFAPFAALSLGAGVMAATLKPRPSEPESIPEAAPVAAPTEEEKIREALTLDDLELEIGYGLIPLVDEKRGGELLSRIRATRRQLAAELGFIVPLIHIRDNLDLPAGGYSIRVRGEEVAGGEIPQNRSLAIAPGEEAEEIPGTPTRDPAFGLPARWIEERHRDRASAAGYAVVDTSTALSTHLSELIRKHAPELLTRRRVQDLLDQFGEDAPKGVEEIVPGVVSLSLLHRTLRSLLAERVSIRDLGTILDTLAEHAGKIQDPDLLTDLVRERLGRSITRPYLEPNGSLPVITLAPELEEQLRGVVQRSESGSFLAVDPVTLDGLVRGVQRAVEAVGLGGEEMGPVLLATQSIRSPLRQIVSRFLPRIAVLSHGELPGGVQVVSMGTVRLEADAH